MRVTCQTQFFSCQIVFEKACLCIERVKKILEGFPFFSFGPIASAALLSWGEIDSSELQKISSLKRIICRKDFLTSPPASTRPPLIAKSSFISEKMVEHLMRHKKDSALGVKYEKGDAITNAEGALHTFVTPVCQIVMTGDFLFAGKLKGEIFGENFVRPVILSAAIHPDFETAEVLMPLVALKEMAMEGEFLEEMDIPSPTQKKEDLFRSLYDERLVKHMIYHLSSTRRLPAAHEVSKEEILKQKEAESYLENLIQGPLEEIHLERKFVKVQDRLLSLDILFHIYKEQLMNEFKAIHQMASRGYVYTIHPPSIFSRELGGASLLNRIQALAFKELSVSGLFSGMRILGFSDYKDPKMVFLLQKALSGETTVVPFSSLYDEKGRYKGPKGVALVLHNNSDAFGQNIETEGPTSLDGVIGSYSNAAAVLKRDRPDLVDFIL